MKRFFALVVVLCLMLPVLPGVAEEKKLHLLWDIPFDTLMEEFVELAYEKAGIVYEVLLDEGDSIVQISVKDQKITFFGYPVESSSVSSIEKNAGISIIIFSLAAYKSTDASFTNLLDQADDILARFTQAYGGLDYGCIEVLLDNDEEEESIYQYPFTSDGKVERKKLATMLGMVGADQVKSFKARWIWNNATASFTYTKSASSVVVSRVVLAWHSTPLYYDGELLLDPIPWNSKEPKVVENIDLGL